MILEANSSPESDLQFIPVFPFRFAAHSFFAQVIPFVIELFAAGQTDLYFDKSLFKIDLEGHDRISLSLYLSLETKDLLFVQEEPAASEGFPVKNIPLLIRTYVHAFNKGLAA